MDMMVMHALAVRRGAPNTFVLGCMPYQSYNTVDRALTNATRFMQDAATDAVKPQGGKSQAHILKALVDAGIPTASHIGLTPHTVAMFGGFRIQGKTADSAMKILEDALAIQDAGSDAVKPQGGKSQAHILKALVDSGIPTASHIGLTPHTIAMFGGFKIQGRTADAAMKILEDALAIEDAGCFMLEFEAVPAKIAKLISEQLTIPTIGIGAGVGTDGQILLCHDLLGVFTDFKPKFTKRFAKLTEVAVTGIKQYIKEVKEGSFPDDDHSYTVKEEEYEKFAALVRKRRQA
jgi:ketopantoate hydroxymethyltransferase